MGAGPRPLPPCALDNQLGTRELNSESRLVRLQEPCLEGEPHQLRPVSDSELLHDPRAIGIDCLGADEEFLTDLTRTKALCSESEDIAFPISHPDEWGALTSRFDRFIILLEDLRSSWIECN